MSRNCQHAGDGDQELAKHVSAHRGGNDRIEFPEFAQIGILLRVCSLDIGRPAAGAAKPDADLVSPFFRTYSVEPQVGIHLNVCPERVPVSQRLSNPENDGIGIEFFLKTTEHSIPEYEYAAVVAIDVAFVLCMMHAVVGWCNDNSVKPAQLADVLRMYPELIDQIDGIDRGEHFDRKTDQEKRQEEYPVEQKTAACLLQCCRKIVVLALVVNGMRRPENRHFVSQAMCPVIAEIPSDESGSPESKTAGRKIEPRELHVHQCKFL